MEEYEDNVLASLMRYCHENREKFKITDNDQITAAGGKGDSAAVRGSNLHKILEYAICPPEKRPKTSPAGYSTILQRFVNDEYMRKQLSLSELAKKIYKGKGARREEISFCTLKKLNNNDAVNKLPFKPDLW